MELNKEGHYDERFIYPDPLFREEHNSDQFHEVELPHYALGIKNEEQNES